MAISGRLYTMGFQNVTLSLAQDLFMIKAGASNIFAVTSVNLGQVTGTAVANCRIRIRYFPTTVTTGSGGSAGTANKWVSGDAASSAATLRTNDTTQATSSGTIVDLWDDQWNIINGFLWVPPIPSRPFVIPVNAAVVVSLDTAPASIVTNGSITWEELP